MGIARNQLTSQSETEIQRTIVSAVPVLLDEVIALDRSTLIMADEVTIAKSVRTSGKDLIVICRKLIFEDGAIIDASGAKGVPDMPANLVKELPREAGLNGADGEDGGRGGDGGNVKVIAEAIVGIPTIITRGGAGGRGQDGGNGTTGSGGSGGARVRAGRDEPRASGGKGGRGGDAGLPGRRGRGGNGGSVELCLISLDGLVTDAIDLGGGAPGEAAKAGSPGAGGPGGPGGVIELRECEPGPGIGGDTFYARDPSFMNVGTPGAPLIQSLFDAFALEEPNRQNALTELRQHSLVIAGERLGGGYRTSRCYPAGTQPGPAGPVGDPGDPRVAETVERQAVEASSDGSLAIVEASYASIGAFYSDAALELICLSVEDEFRRGQGTELEAVREKVSFLLKICDVARADGPIKHAILARAYAMARKLALGLDFYGCSSEWAPLISFDTYAALMNEYVIGPAFEIERSFNSYWDEAASKETKRNEIRKAVGSAEQQVSILLIEQDRVENDARNLLKSLEGMDAQVNATLAFLMLKETELTDAIRRKHDRCDLVGTLIAVATIVVGVASGGTALIGAVAAGNKLYQDYSEYDGSIDELWDNRKIIQDDLKEVGKKGEDIIDSINKIQEGVARLTPEQRRLPQFKMERAQFDKVAADFVDIPEAAAYREAGYAYLKAVETRNQAIVDYNSMLVQLVEYQARFASAQIARDALASALSAKVDPAEPIVVAAMNRIYLDTLSMAAQMVHAEKKALAYHFGRPAIATVSALNMSLIAGEHIRVAVTQWAAAKNRYAARRRLETGQLSINLHEIVDEETWSDFKANGILSFTIRRDHPRYAALLSSMPGLRITGMEILLAGAQIAEGQTQIPWTMLQMGSELVYTGDGTPMAFSHRPVLFRGWTPIAGAGRLVDPDFSENDLYAGISPYAAWQFTFLAHPTLGLNLDELESATLKMSGYLIDG